MLYGPLAPWLIVKLGVVGLLVLGHASCGMLVLRIERQESRDEIGGREVRGRKVSTERRHASHGRIGRRASGSGEGLESRQAKKPVRQCGMSNAGADLDRSVADRDRLQRG